MVHIRGQASECGPPADAIGTAFRLAFEVPPPCPVIAALLLRITMIDIGGARHCSSGVSLDTAAPRIFIRTAPVRPARVKET